MTERRKTKREEGAAGMERLEKKVEAFASRYEMICPGDGIVLGLSGGADSVCLLFMLKWLRDRIPFRLAAVHVNHNLRGEESVRDQEFSRRLCRETQIPFFAVSVSVKDMAEKEKLSLEEAGRKARYQAFARICREEGYEKVALAHHRDDLAETMIYHLARGTGIGGLCSIRPVSGNRIRPLLCVGRREIEEWLNSRGIPWQTDSTNLDDHFTRNKIRHHVADYLIKEINPKAAVHMAATARELWELDRLAEDLTEEHLARLSDHRDGGIFLDQACGELPAVLRQRMLHKVIAGEAGGARDITRSHVEAADGLWKKQAGKYVCLPGGIRVRREYAGLWVGRGEESVEQETFAVPVPGTVRLGQYQISCRILPNEFGRIEEKTYTKCLDYDKINQCLQIRHRKPGDRFAANPRGGKKLKDYLIDCKIPRRERDGLWLLADGPEIIWIIGGRISERYKVSEKTQRVLYMQIKGGRIYE